MKPIKIQDSPILRKISRILTQIGFQHYIDWRVKKLKNGRRLLCFYKRPHRLLFAHYFDDYILQVVTPKRFSIDKIRAIYGIEGYDILGQDFRLKSHYFLDISLLDGKLNGKFAVEEKKTFFIDIALSSNFLNVQTNDQLNFAYKKLVDRYNGLKAGVNTDPINSTGN
jgi:hypothetical protein